MTFLPKDTSRDGRRHPERLLSARERAFLQYWYEAEFDRSKIEECAVKAGYPPGTQGVEQGGRAWSRALKNKEFQLALEKQGIQFERMAKKLDQLLEAEHPMYQGKPDNFIQHKALETAIRVMDANPPTKVDIDKHEEKNIVISMETMSMIEDVLDVEFEKVEEPKQLSE